MGYGKMGKTIEKIAKERGHEIIGRIDNNNEPKDPFSGENTDVAIEFSQPDAAEDNIRWCLKTGIPVLSGTTGWLDQKESVMEYCRKKDGTFFYASNYSIGVNLFFMVNKYLASLMNSYESYSVTVEETHHIEKKDSPSGTAITLAEGIIDEIDSKKNYAEGTKVSDSDVGIVSFREEDVPGTHIVKYKSEEDSIEIKHTAFSRKGFALGAVKVAEWLVHQKGVLTMADFLKDQK